MIRFHVVAYLRVCVHLFGGFTTVTLAEPSPFLAEPSSVLAVIRHLCKIHYDSFSVVRHFCKIQYNFFLWSGTLIVFH